MRKTHIRQLILILCISAFTGGVFSSQAYAQMAHECNHDHSMVKAIYEDMNTTVAPVHNMASAQRTAVFNVTYTGFTPEAQAAFQYAVDIWSTLLTSTQTIEVDANWEDLGASTLGQAGAWTFVTDFTGAEESNTFYPIALANKLANSDLFPFDPDISATFNSTANWYYGTDGNCPAGLFDFVSVVLHELGHGLGFAGSAYVENTLGYVGLGFNEFPTIYDLYVENGAGTDILDFSNGSSAMESQLTSNDLHFNGMNAVSANTGVVELYAPSTWEGGSSYSHWNENAFPAGNTNSLMTPFIGQSEVIHHPGAAALGLMEDIGWTVEIGGECLPLSVIASDGGCQEDEFGELLPIISLTFDLDGDCVVQDLCWGIDGATPECVNLPANGFDIQSGGGINLINTTADATYEIYFTTTAGTSQTITYVNGNCDTEISGCTDPLATNYDPSATADDGSCTYDFTVCDCIGTEHTAGVLTWLGDGFADDGGFDYEGQPVDFNCETWGYDCGDIIDTPGTDPYNVCGGDLPPNNGCGGSCLPTAITAADGGCQEDDFGVLLPIISLNFTIDGDCMVEDLCWGIDGATPECVNMPDNGFELFDGDGINLINTTPDATYIIYFTTSDGTSTSITYVNGNCDTEISGCTDPLATNYDPSATADDGSCVYDFTVCDCIGTEHTAGVLTWLGDGFADDGAFDYEGQPVDFNCETWGYDCGDIDGAPSADPHNVCGGDLPPNNGCEGGCLPELIVATDGGCQEDDLGVLLPVISLNFTIDGDCMVEDLCWGIDGATPECVNMPDNGFELFDGDGINLINTTPDATYVIYFTTSDGTSTSITYVNGNCDTEISGCTDPLATNYDPSATADDGSCVYDFTVCDCVGTEHTAGVLTWLGDGFADDGAFEYEGQLVDFNCETWGYDCGDIDGAPSADPHNVCGGDLPPNNGCEGGCLPELIVASDGGCQEDDLGVLLPVISLNFTIDGDCMVEDLCWGIDGATPECVNMPDNGFELFDGDGINLINTTPDATYVIYFTTSDGTSTSITYVNGSCEEEDILGCTDPDAINYNPEANVDDGSCMYECVTPTVGFTPFCNDIDDDEFYVTVEVFDIGTMAPYTMSNDQNPGTTSVNSTGSFVLGPFNSGADVVFTMESDEDETCAESYPIVSYECLTGLEDLESLGVQAYPNPFDQQITLKTDILDIYTIRLSDATGRILIEQQVNARTYVLDTSRLSKGIYQLSLSSDNKQAQASFIKQ